MLLVQFACGACLWKKLTLFCPVACTSMIKIAYYVHVAA